MIHGFILKNRDIIMGNILDILKSLHSRYSDLQSDYDTLRSRSYTSNKSKKR